MSYHHGHIRWRLTNRRIDCLGMVSFTALYDYYFRMSDVVPHPPLKTNSASDFRCRGSRSRSLWSSPRYRGFRRIQWRGRSGSEAIVLAYKSRHKPVPLSELEKLLVVTACGGNTGWHHMICRAKLYAPHLSNYSAAAGGRSFPSAAGFHTSKTFFTDDEGVYLLDNRDSSACAERAPDGSLDFEAAIDSR